MLEFIVEHSFLDELNTVQKEAVMYNDGPSLVIAGAGSGKTRVLTYKIAFLLNAGYHPRSILALTFTNKAAREMKERIASITSPEIASQLWMGTFHSRFTTILRAESNLLGYPSSFSIYDTTDSKNAIKQIIKDLNLDDKIYKPNEVLSRISKAKNNLITAGAYASNDKLTSADKATRRPEIARIYEFYASRCKKSGAMDFDDLLLNTNILFRDHPDVLAKYQDKFKFILVDEYQDTNFAQYLIIRKLAEKHGRLCVVGDDAQSIYAFRGAKIENILNYRKDYPNYKLFKLEQNYRSTQNIVDAANSLIAKNDGQIPKKVFSENAKGSQIEVLESYTDREEGALISKMVVESALQHRVKYNDMAVLYRTNAQSRIFEEAFRKANIPYRIFGGLSFYQRKEIKDLIAYFRLTVNPGDDEAFRRIVNYPARGIGKTTLGKLDAMAHQFELSIWDTIKYLPKFQHDINKASVAKLQGFVDLIHTFSEGIENRDAYDSAYKIAVDSGILKDLHNDQSPEGLSRYENIQELLNGIKDFTLIDGEDRNIPLSEYLQNIALLTDQDTDNSEEENKITLMTIHAAKGLEFRYVYIVGMEENLFPSSRSVSSPADLEEERRLFYVAITRAKEKLMISYTKSRYVWGSLESCKPSRFIKDISAQYLNLPSSNESFYDQGISAPRIDTPKPSWVKNKGARKESSTGGGGMFNTKRPNIPSRATSLSKVSSSQGSQPSADFDEIVPGVKVSHERFGVGTVVHKESSDKATVDFIEHGSKQLLLKFAKLKVIKD